MNGKQEIELKKEEKIERLIEKSKNKILLNEYDIFLGDNIALNTKYDYIRYANNFTEWCNKRLNLITIEDYIAYLKLFEDKVASTQIAVYSALKKYSEFLLKSGKTKANPMPYVKRPKFQESKETVEKRENGWMDKNEIEKYIVSVENGTQSERAKHRQENWRERDLLIILLFLNTGIECSALCKLDVDSIDITEKRLIAETRGNKVKSFHLSDELMEYVFKWLKKRTELLKGKNIPALFISNRRERINYQTVFALVKKYSENIEGKEISPHKLRATFGTNLYNETKDISLVQEMMGHNSPKTTEMYIRDREKVDSQKVAEIMSRITMK